MTTAPGRRCDTCGYDLRGISSRICPECGQTRSITLRIDDARAFHIARAALEHAGILRSCIDPMGLFNYRSAAASTSGYVCLAEADLERAESLLEGHGIAWIEEHASLVDPRDPTCPQCGRELVEIGASECPHCRHRVYWLEQASDIGPDDDIVCPECLDEVTLVDGRCPKCGATIADTPPRAEEPARD